MQWSDYRWIKHTSKICIYKDMCHNTTNKINQATFMICRPPLWSSDQVPGYRSREPEFDSRRYQIFREVVGLERGPLSLMV
jgi:hypothetical protein